MAFRYIRIGVAIFVFGVLALNYFFEYKSALGVVSEGVQFFQFIPSLIQFLRNPASILGFGFWTVLILTILFGRVYCSFLCPLGILQDLFITVSKKIGLRPRHGTQPSFPTMRYAFMIGTIISGGLGSLVLVNILDPYSLFGRIVDHLFKSLAIFFNNRAAEILGSFDYFSLPAKAQHAIPLFLLVITLFIFLIILAFSIFYGRSYCNIICPVGTLLGLISRHSLLKITINSDGCRSCGLCEDICKAGCINAKKKEVENARCVTCFNCLSFCKYNAIIYGSRVNPGEDYQAAKRWFLVQSATLGSVLFRHSSPVRYFLSSTHQKRPLPITPPGSLSVADFKETCIACHLCVSTCKTHVLSPTLLEHGWSGFLQPSMDFGIGHCDFNCNACGKVCPTGSIRLLRLEDKQRVQIGTATLNESRCVVYTRKTHCGACGEACPTFAILPKGAQDHFAPVLDVSYCIGCGACEKACPTRPKSIQVAAKAVHTVAKVRSANYLPRKKIETKETAPFPF